MTSKPPLLDLLVIGGMTVDRFADGSSAPGGTVVHVARAVAARGLRVGIVTTSGDEPEVRNGLRVLRRMAAVVERRPHDHSTTFRHSESAEGRRLWLEHRGGSVHEDPRTGDRFPTPAILFAPILGEIPTSALTVWDGRWRRGAVLQGWLRNAEEGAEVRPRPLRSIEPAVVNALAQFDLLVASREDLLAESDAPDDQLAVLRRAFGPTPALVVTDGVEGLWLDAQAGSSHLAVPRRVDAASTVGAGDILAAFMTIRSEDPSRSIRIRAEDAMRVVAEVLEGRRG